MRCSADIGQNMTKISKTVSFIELSLTFTNFCFDFNFVFSKGTILTFAIKDNSTEYFPFQSNKFKKF